MRRFSNPMPEADPMSSIRPAPPSSAKQTLPAPARSAGRYCKKCVENFWKIIFQLLYSGNYRRSWSGLYDLRGSADSESERVEVRAGSSYFRSADELFRRGFSEGSPVGEPIDGPSGCDLRAFAWRFCHDKQSPIGQMGRIKKKGGATADKGLNQARNIPRNAIFGKLTRSDGVIGLRSVSSLLTP